MKVSNRYLFKTTDNSWLHDGYYYETEKEPSRSEAKLKIQHAWLLYREIRLLKLITLLAALAHWLFSNTFHLGAKRAVSSFDLPVSHSTLNRLLATYQPQSAQLANGRPHYAETDAQQTHSDATSGGPSKYKPNSTATIHRLRKCSLFKSDTDGHHP